MRARSALFFSSIIYCIRLHILLQDVLRERCLTSLSWPFVTASLFDTTTRE